MSLRNKQALILFLATVLPFALGAGAVGVVVAPAYRRTVAHAAEVETGCLAQGVAWNLSRSVDRLERLAAWREIRQLAQRSPMDAGDAAALDRRWGDLKPEDEPLRSLLQNAVARELSWWQETDPTTVAVLATDTRGQVIAASRKPSAFQMGDRSWWREVYAEGAGRATVSQITQDRVTQGWVIRVGVPIYADGTPSSRLIGVLAAFLDAPRTFQEVRRASVGESGRAFLVDEQGRIMVSTFGQAPLRDTLDLPGLRRLTSSPNGTFVAKQDDNADLFAWSAVALDHRVGLANARTPALYVVTRRSAAEAFGPLRAVNQGMLIIGLFTIAAAVALGYWLVDVWVVRQVRQLANGMRELSRGNFEKAAVIAEQLTHSTAGQPEAEERASIPH